MNDFTVSLSNFPFRNRSRSIGVKLIVISCLALLMVIPSFFVANLVEDRTKLEADVVRDISVHVGGHQTFLGPVLAIPYTVPPQFTNDHGRSGMYLVFPAEATANIRIATQERHRSLFKVPVFQADSRLAASFDLTGVPNSPPSGAEFDWSRAEILVGVSDPRGALADATLTFGGKTLTMAPAEISQTISFNGDQNSPLRLTLFGARAAEFVKPNTRFDVTTALRFSGAQRIALLAYGKTTRLTVQGDWPNPGFDGGFLPASRTVSPKGFTAEWSLPFIARGVRAEGQSEMITGLDSTALGVSFIEVADPYQSVNRSLKYVLLFLGLIFLSYFIFEIITGKRVHLAQYILVGVAQIIFYLLLLSLAERIGFDLGFLIGGTATVSLLSVNAGWIFISWLQAARAFAIFTALYSMIYLMLRLEDNSLLVGAIASFLAVAAAMYFTRRVDWYSSLPQPITAEKQP